MHIQRLQIKHNKTNQAHFQFTKQPRMVYTFIVVYALSIKHPSLCLSNLFDIMNFYVMHISDDDDGGGGRNTKHHRWLISDG